MTCQQLDEGLLASAEPTLHRHRLPRVLPDSPAAALLVGAGTRCVVQAGGDGYDLFWAYGDLDDDVPLLVVRVLP